MDLSVLSDKMLIEEYIFQYPSKHPEEQEIIEEELNRRGLYKEAEQLFAKVNEYFRYLWKEKEKRE